jgi:hypothetical protein
MTRRLVVAAALAYAALVAFTLVTSTALGRALLVVNLSVLLSVGLLARFTRDRPRPERTVLYGALALKLVASAVRYRVAFDLYGGVADAARYHERGVLLGQSFGDGHFAVDSPLPLVGTTFIEIVTGILYALVGPTLIGAFVAFACLGFWVEYLFHRAFNIAVPEGATGRYAALVLFFPSLLFWPASVGKDAWMLFSLGLAAYGVAGYMTNRRSGVPLFALGLAASCMVRPHVGLAVAAAFVVALVVGRRPGSRLIGLAVAAVAMAVVLAQVQQYFNLDTIDAVAVEQVIDSTREQTSQGGSAFDAPRSRSLAGLPLAVFSVLFRPLPWEAGSMLILAASLEGLVLLALFVRLRRNVATSVTRGRVQPFVLFALTYSVVFCLAFSSFGNFGILARQRVQLFPFVFVLLAFERRPSEQLDVAQAQVEVAA